MNRPYIASVDAIGVIHIGRRTATGAVAILKAEDEGTLRAVIEPAARHAYDGKTLLAPGVAEADDQEQGMTALIKWRDWIFKGLPIDFGQVLPRAEYQESRA